MEQISQIPWQQLGIVGGIAAILVLALTGLLWWLIKVSLPKILDDTKAERQADAEACREERKEMLVAFREEMKAQRDQSDRHHEQLVAKIDFLAMQQRSK